MAPRLRLSPPPKERRVGGFHLYNSPLRSSALDFTPKRRSLLAPVAVFLAATSAAFMAVHSVLYATTSNLTLADTMLLLRSNAGRHLSATGSTSMDDTVPETPVSPSSSTNSNAAVTMEDLQLLPDHARPGVVWLMSFPNR